MDKLKDILEGIIRIPCMFFALFGPSICLMEYFKNNELFIAGLPFGLYLIWIFLKGIKARDIELKERSAYDRDN